MLSTEERWSDFFLGRDGCVHKMLRSRLTLLLLIPVLASGCAKGALWKLGYLSPQVRQQWAEEEKYARTWQTMETDMTAAVERAKEGGLAEQQRTARQLGAMIQDDHRVMVRIHATELLGQMSPDAARGALMIAAEDPEADVRIAACQALARWGDADSLIGLQKILGSDTHPDVRMAATRGIGNFKGPQAARALRMALNSESPALQLAAAASLKKCTGENLGQDIPAWQEYVAALPEPKAYDVQMASVDDDPKQDKSLWGPLFRQ